MTITLTKEELEQKQKEWQMQLGDFKLAILNIICEKICIPVEDAKALRTLLPPPPKITLL